ncbi:MAG: SMP-30/gluconolactonase/LRE family protein [Propionibacteriales bacterium]|nr:SMP-30/gluconolactonase/LRE family protein [Propionibacteriales bacterium]
MSRTPLHPRRWKPPKRSRDEPIPPHLPPVNVIEVPGHGTEDVLVDGAGKVLTGTEDGKIYRIGYDGGVIEQVADTGGRPLGLEMAPDRSLIVCDARRGLLSIDIRGKGGGEVGGEPEVLVDRIDGVPMSFCNNAAVAADGTIYFTDTCARFGVDDWMGELLEHSRTGRLFRRTPEGDVELLLDHLAFANGVALAADESFVAVAETAAYRIRRYWLTGERAGQHDLLVDNLPGFPDNMSTGSDGLLWAAIAAPRDPMLDLMLPRAPVLRKVAWALPESLLPKEKRTVRVQAYDDAGTLVHDLNGTHDNFHMVTGVREHLGTVWVGSLREPAIAAIGPLAATS